MSYPVYPICGRRNKNKFKKMFLGNVSREPVIKMGRMELPRQCAQAGTYIPRTQVCKHFWWI